MTEGLDRALFVFVTTNIFNLHEVFNATNKDN